MHDCLSTSNTILVVVLWLTSNSQTDIEGLYAIGETSYTGLHGANRMASNSLLECFVYGMSAAKDIESKFDINFKLPEVPTWDDSQPIQMKMS